MTKEWDSCLQTITAGGETIKVPTLKCLEVVFSNILAVSIGLAILALFVMFMIAGFKRLTSGGDPKATASSQQTMTSALIGMVLLVLAFIIFRLIEQFTGVTVTKFEIPNQ